MTRSYGVLYGSTVGKIDYPEMKGMISQRSFFLVDQQGIVRGRWLGEDMDVFPNEGLLEAAREVAEKR